MKSSAPVSLGKINYKSLNFEWVGWFAILIGFCITTYYSVIMGWSFDYLFYSMKISWGTDPTGFFYNNVLGLTDSVFKIGSIQWHIVTGLVFSWIWILASIWEGAKTVGKVVYVTVTLPWLLLIIFVIRGVNLPGAMEGIKYYLLPNWKMLLSFELWHAAISQIFFSLTVGFGVMIAYASFLSEKAEIVRDAFIIGLADAATAFVAGFAVFSALGYHAVTTGSSVHAVMKSGPELAFCTYPTIIGKLPFPQLFGILFFIMLLTLAIDSAFSLVESVSASITDKFGWSRKRSNMTVGIIGLILGLIYTTGSGLYWLDIVDYFMNNFGLFLVGLLECIIITLFFKTEKMREYINSLRGTRIGKWWSYSIIFIVPLVTTILILSTFIERLRVSYGGYPRQAESVGWGLLVVFLLLSILITKMKGKKNE